MSDLARPGLVLFVGCLMGAAAVQAVVGGVTSWGDVGAITRNALVAGVCGFGGYVMGWRQGASTRGSARGTDSPEGPDDQLSRRRLAGRRASPR